jgi:hypothetical protein
VNAAGLRKTALYLASLPAGDRERLLAELPKDAAARLRPLVATVIENGWADAELVGRALAEEIRGLTSQTALSVDALLALAKSVPADWAARVVAANAATDPRFFVALLDAPARDKVAAELHRVPRLPGALRDAILAEAAASVRHA